MKDKTTAGLLALFLGGAGIHRFYLNQSGLGIAYIILTIATCGVFAITVPIIDALVFFFMDKYSFDFKYNPERIPAQQVHVHVHQAQPRVKRKQPVRKQPAKKVRTSAPPKPNVQKPKIPHNPHKIAGIAKFKQYDFKGAKESFEKALTIYHDDIATHFNLGCCYSMEEDVEKSMLHLSTSVALGFKDFKRIHSHDALAYLRSHDEFLDFVKNNYRWEAEPEKEAEEVDKLKTLAPPKPNVLDEEEKTAILDLNTPAKEKEKIILTDIKSKEELQQKSNIFDDFFDLSDDDAYEPPSAQNPQLSGDLVDKLKQLAELRDKGILTESEFIDQKKRLLG